MSPQKSVIPFKKLGQLLVDTGIITSQQLNEALELQKQSGGKLGQILLQLGYISEEVLLTFLARQSGIQFVSLQEYGIIPEDVIKTVPENVARHKILIPIEKKGNVLTVAISDPFNVFVIDDLKLMTGFDINIVLAQEKEIKETIEKYYTTKENINEVLKEIEIQTPETVKVVKEEETTPDIFSLEQQAEEAPVVKLVNLILSNAIKMKASDIHIEPYEKSLRVRYRIDGVLHEFQNPPKKFHNAIVSRLKIMSNLDISEHRLPQDGRSKIKISDREVDIRISILPTNFGEKIVMRILDSSNLCLDLNKLGFEPETLAIYQNGIKSPYGIIFITGPTGSGKSTTLYSTLSTINHPDVNIMTIEDPVEYVMEGINQVQAKPDIGLTFAAGLRSFLRQDPDIIMVGEIRDKETADIAINAALTGHLVLSTLHTNDAPGAITRLNNMGIEPFLISSTIVVVIAQRLVRTICKYCKEPYELPAEELIPLGVNEEYLKDTKKVILYKGKGCEYCAKGYKGRLGIYEVMAMNDEIRELVIKKVPANIIKEAARRNGMLTLRESALRKLLGGITTVEEVLRVTTEDVHS